MSKNFQSFWMRHRDPLTLLLLCVSSLILMRMNETGPVRLCRRTVQSIFHYPQLYMQWIPQSIENWKRNSELEREVSALRLQEQQFHEALVENRRLKALLNFKEKSHFDLVPARVTACGSQGLLGSIHLNAGYEKGCKKNQSIINHRGVVGKLVMVNTDFSTGQLLADASSRISVKVQHNGITGILRWMHGNLFQMEGVPSRSDVKPGDRIVTSGLSEIYPKGLLVGYVIHSSSKPGDLFHTLHIRSAVDFHRLDWVVVLISD